MRGGMMRTFHKMHGLGNDFAIFDAREEPLAMTEPLARALADRRTGIGCDQLILLEPSDQADLRMRIWNHDGGEVRELRQCLALRRRSDRAPRRIETGGGIVSGAAEGGESRSRSPSRASAGTTSPRLRDGHRRAADGAGARWKSRWRSMSATRIWSSSSPTPSVAARGARPEHRA